MIDILKIITAVVLGVISNIGACQSPLNWEIAEIYSNADGSVQFIKFSNSSGSAPPPSLVGQTLVAGNGLAGHSFTFPSDVPPTGYDGDSGYFTIFLVATQGFADFKLVKPDFVVPDRFLFHPAGSLRLGVSEVHYESLPFDGENAVSLESPPGFQIRPAVAVRNDNRQSYKFMPVGVNPVVEYYNSQADDYFLTGYSDEIAALDAAGGGWQRTGYTINAWTSPFSGGKPPPDLTPVCRLFLGDSHFFSVSPAECVNVADSMISRHPDWWYVHEADAVFFATLPDADTGTCPKDQMPAYRLWSPRGSIHRYTTQTDVRDDMLSRGYIAEGYGPDNVAMCVGGNK